MTHDACRGSLETSLTREHSTPPSDSQGRFDGSITEPMSTFPMIWLSLRTRRASTPLGSYILGRGTGHITLGGLLCGSALFRCVKSQGFASRFPFHTTEYAAPSLDPDLEHLLQVGLRGWSNWLCAVELLKISPEHTPSLTIDFGYTVASLLGQPRQTRPSACLVWNFRCD